MEKNRVQSNVLIVCFVFGLLVGQSTASFKSCYKECFILCVVTGKSFVSCAGKCLKDCIVPISLENLNNNFQDFCKLGCASSLCTNLSTRQNPAEEEVESCVDSCSKTCNKN